MWLARRTCQAFSTSVGSISRSLRHARNDGDHCILVSIHDPIGRELELAKPRRLELRDDPAAVGKLHEVLDLLDDRDDHACADLGRLLR